MKTSSTKRCTFATLTGRTFDTRQRPDNGVRDDAKTDEQTPTRRSQLMAAKKTAKKTAKKSAKEEGKR